MASHSASESVCGRRDVYRRLIPHVEHHQRGVDAWRGCEGGRRNGEDDPRVGEHLHRDCGQACAARGRPSLCHFFLDHEGEQPRARRVVEELADQRAREVVRDVPCDNVAAARKCCGLVELEDVPFHDLDALQAFEHLAEHRNQAPVELDRNQSAAHSRQRHGQPACACPYF